MTFSVELSPKSFSNELELVKKTNAIAEIILWGSQCDANITYSHVCSPMQECDILMSLKGSQMFIDDYLNGL